MNAIRSISTVTVLFGMVLFCFNHSSISGNRQNKEACSRLAEMAKYIRRSNAFGARDS